MDEESIPATDRRTDPAEGRTASATELLLGGEPRYTTAQAAELAGVDLERATRLWSSLGYATPSDTDPVFTDADVQALRTVTSLHDAGIVDTDTELALTRAMGQAMARLTEWQVSVLRELVLAKVSDPEDTAAITSSGLDAAALLIPQVEQLQQYVWRRHLLAASDRILTSAPNGSEAGPLSVGFADVVGFTSLSRGLTESRLSQFLESFESYASSVVTEHGGRVVKTLGDEVMFASEDPVGAAGIAVDLADRMSDLDGRPELRVGLAHGPVLRRLGDLYGSVVNLASRLTTVARPGTVLVDREFATAVGEQRDYRVRRLRRVAVRGFAHLQPWLLRRAEVDERG